MFETFNVRGFDLRSNLVLSLCSVGHTTGLVLELGAGTTNSGAIYEGTHLSNTISSNRISGKLLDNYWSTFFTEKHTFNSITLRELLLAKEKLCHVMPNEQEYERILSWQSKHKKEKTYEIPDGPTLQIGPEMFQLPELLFRPQMPAPRLLPPHNQTPIQNLLLTTLQHSPSSLQPHLIKNLCITGGSSMFKGFDKRLVHEFALLLEGQGLGSIRPSYFRTIHESNTNFISRVPFELIPNLEKYELPYPTVITNNHDRRLTAWIGGAILARLPDFQKKMVSKEDYDELGPVVVRWKCW